ncbi:hypothetical protein ABZT17_35310 [Streptomyces sp. NPDC005648]|uniref:hypothetical protein n=1 Tax=Streptomyces sp. NPDC005648 TaxID=3157044 RepID=UPI0033B681D9
MGRHEFDFEPGGEDSERRALREGEREAAEREAAERRERQAASADALRAAQDSLRGQPELTRLHALRDGLRRIETASRAGNEALRNEEVFRALRERAIELFTSSSECLADQAFWQRLEDGWDNLHQLTSDLAGRLEPLLWLGVAPLLTAVGYRTPPPPSVDEFVIGITDTVRLAVEGPRDPATAAMRIRRLQADLAALLYRARRQIPDLVPRTPAELGAFRQSMEVLFRVGRDLLVPTAVLAGRTALNQVVPGSGELADAAAKSLAEHRRVLAAAAVVAANETPPAPTLPGPEARRDWIAVRCAALLVGVQEADKARTRLLDTFSVPAPDPKARQQAWDDYLLGIGAAHLHAGALKDLLTRGARMTPVLRQNLDVVLTELEFKARSAHQWKRLPDSLLPTYDARGQLFEDLDVATVREHAAMTRELAVRRTPRPPRPGDGGLRP